MDRNLFWLLPILILLNLFSTVKAESPNLRLLCIKHSRENMADGDADLAMSAAREAANKGLNIKVIGNHFVDGKMIAKLSEDNFVAHVYDKETLTKYVEQYVNVDAVRGDTLIVFTIGHGFQDGTLQNLGPRKDVQKALSDIAEKYNQKIFWWQLSCYASSGLPGIETLNTKQQNLISMFASSAANEQSPAYVQGNIMAKVFNALAERSTAIDPNKDSKVTLKEFRTFMETINPSYGKRTHAKSLETVVFGRQIPYIPIVDRNGKQNKYDEDYILLPN